MALRYIKQMYDLSLDQRWGLSMKTSDDQNKGHVFVTYTKIAVVQMLLTMNQTSMLWYKNNM